MVAGIESVRAFEATTPRACAVAAVAGLGVAVLVLAVLGRPLNSITTYPISAYYLETAVSLGGGANAVNVILVDFRGFDTLGEITVLAMAALIVATVTGQVRVSTACKRDYGSDHNSGPNP